MRREIRRIRWWRWRRRVGHSFANAPCIGIPIIITRMSRCTGSYPFRRVTYNSRIGCIHQPYLIGFGWEAWDIFKVAPKSYIHMNAYVRKACFINKGNICKFISETGQVVLSKVPHRFLTLLHRRNVFIIRPGL